MATIRNINLDEVKNTLDKILRRDISREQASNWAMDLRIANDERCLVYLPAELEGVLWDSILFIEGIDLKVDPKTYLYGEEDIKIFLDRLHSV